jgi:hypothetical protein
MIALPLPDRGHRVRLSPYSGGRAESRPVTCQDIIDVVQEAVEWHANS